MPDPALKPSPGAIAHAAHRAELGAVVPPWDDLTDVERAAWEAAAEAAIAAAASPAMVDIIEEARVVRASRAVQVPEVAHSLIYQHRNALDAEIRTDRPSCRDRFVQVGAIALAALEALDAEARR